MLASGLCPRYDLDSSRLNAQPWLNRLWWVAFATDIVGQIVAVMFMQFLIERGDVFTTTLVTVHLYFAGGTNIQTKYQDRLMDPNWNQTAIEVSGPLRPISGRMDQ